MSQTTRSILLTIVIIAAAVWGISVYKSCKAAGDSTPSSSNTELRPYKGDDEATTTSGEEDKEFADMEGENEGEEDGEATAMDASTDSDSGTTDEETTTTSEDEERGTLDEYGGVRGGGDGEFLVIAAAFTSRRNARKTRDQLNKKGYKSEVRIFLGSDYHSLLLGNYSTESEAQKVANAIKKDSNFKDAYVHKKRYLKKRR